MGIVDYHGSELDEKQLENHLVDFAKETAGVFLPPLASNIIGLVNMVNRVVDIIMDLQGTEVPEIIKEAKKLASERKDMFLGHSIERKTLENKTIQLQELQTLDFNRSK